MATLQVYITGKIPQKHLDMIKTLKRLRGRERGTAKARQSSLPPPCLPGDLYNNNMASVFRAASMELVRVKAKRVADGSASP